VKNIVLGTASLGSLVSQAEGRRIIRAAYEMGVRHFDTAPLYGAGFAPGLLSELKGTACRTSTKFAGHREAVIRFLAKRLVRCEGARNFATGLPALCKRPRRGPHDWSAQRQEHAATLAMAQLNGLQPEFLFIHSPPQAIGETALVEFAALARSGGFKLGLCSPTDGELATLASAPSAAVKCYQLHLDQLMKVDAPDIASLAQSALWIHGVYTPTPGTQLPNVRAREEYCVTISRQHPSVKFVIGCKSVEGLARLAAFEEVLARARPDKTTQGEEKRNE
jgi:aryl-alcohol dehydrogenase-like predicted oxidoreductase